MAISGRANLQTRCEREASRLVTEGLSNQEIADQLEISSRIVEMHRANMLDEIDPAQISEAVRGAIGASRGS